MIQVLGIKRVVTIVVLVGVIAVLSGSYYFVVLPQQEKVERELRQVKSSISSARSNTDRLRRDFATLEQVKTRYAEIQQYGFFSDQNRVVARAKINEMKEESGVISARYTISASENEGDESLKTIGHDLMRSTIKFSVEAYDDVDVYRFIYLLNYGFPGMVDINRVVIERTRDVSAPLLRNIGTGSKTSLVNAQINADWFTVVPLEDDSTGDR